MKSTAIVVRAAARDSIYMMALSSTRLQAIHFLFVFDRIYDRITLEEFSGHLRLIG